MRYLHSIAAASALAFACHDATAGDQGGAPAPAEAAPSTVVEFEFPSLTGKQSMDLATIPASVRFDFLSGAVRSYIANRLNGVATRHKNDPAVAAWFAYDEAIKADPLQTAVAKPEGERPVEPDYAAAFVRATKDLTEGNVRRVSDEPKGRKTKDPLISLVTDVVVRALFDARKAQDSKYSFLTAKKEVGPDGLKYLNDQIDAKVAGFPADQQATVRSQLETVRDQKYVNPAQAMLGITTDKKIGALPSIL